MNRIHPLSVLLGLVLAGLCFLTMSQVPVLSLAAVRIEYIPHPRDMVQIQEGVPFVVPQNRIFVLTGLGSTAGTASPAQLYVNGVEAVDCLTGQAGSYLVGITIQAVPVGFTVPAGSTVTVVGQVPFSFGRALGYLSSL